MVDFFNGAARKIARFVCVPGMNKVVGSVLSTAYSGMVVQTLLSQPSGGRGGKIRSTRPFWAIYSHLKVNVTYMRPV